MNSTLSVTITTTDTNIPPLPNTHDDMTYSSFTIGIIVLCIASGLIVVSLCIFLYIKKRRPSNASLNTEKQQGEKSGHRLWPFTAPLKSSESMESMDPTASIHHDNITLKTRLASLSTVILPSRKKKTVLVAKPESTMLDDIPLPPPTTTSLPTPLPVAASALKWQKGQYMEKNSPIVFEEGYDPKALLPTPYYYQHHTNKHHHQRSPSRQHPTTSSCTMTSPPNNGSFSSVDDPHLLESLERQKHINDIYYRTSTTSASTSTATFHCHHRPSPSWSSSTVIQQPCINGKCNNNNNNSSSLLSLSVAEKLEQDAELQRMSISTYHVW